jgi:ribosomal protein L22
VELPKSGSGFQAEYDDEEIEVARAYEKEVPGSPHKFRRVLDIIRGLSYVDALSVLTYSPYRRASSHTSPPVIFEDGKLQTYLQY